MSAAWTPHLRAVILAGGSGTRLWPLSHRRLPKQFLTLNTGASLIRLTLQRLRDLLPIDKVWMVGGSSHVGLAASQLPELTPGQILAEPQAKNTAPAIALAAVRMLAEDPEALMVVLPADHFIPEGDEAEFRRRLEVGIGLAWEKSGLVTLGIHPTSPATGYGYIEMGEKFQSGAGEYFRARSFKEKPDAATATAYLASGKYFWNSGIFIWKASVFLEKLTRHHPAIGEAFAALLQQAKGPHFEGEVAKVFGEIESISVDYALMEKAEDVWIVPAEIAWNDVGSLASLACLLPEDAQGNHFQREIFPLDSRGNLVIADKPVALIGVEGMAVVETKAALLVVPLDRAQEVKDLVQRLKELGREDLI